MTVRVAAIGDLHYGRESRDVLKPVLQAVEDARPDVLLLLGDLTDYGTPEEAQALTRELVAGIKVPMLAVLGNHDCEANATEKVRDALREGGFVVVGRQLRGEGRRFRGREGFLRWVWPRCPRPMGGGGRQALRTRGRPGSLETGTRARTSADLRANRAAALRTGRRDRDRRAARNLPLSRKQPPRGAAQPARRDRDLPRPCAQGRCRRAHNGWGPRLQRVPAPDDAAVSRAATADPGC